MRSMGRIRRRLCLPLLAGLLCGHTLAVEARAQETTPPSWREPYERAAALAQKGEAEAAIDAILESFRAGLDDPSIPLCDARFDGVRPERGFRSAMRSISRTGPLQMVAKDEPGTELVIRGQIKDAKGKPATSAIVYAFQADAEGRYTREEAMDEPHARIFGYARADEYGRFEIHTVHPGVYPEREDVDGPARFTPESVHFNITLWDGSVHDFLLVFANSPRMQHGYWRQWAQDNGNPMATIAKVEGGGEECHFTLQFAP